MIQTIMEYIVPKHVTLKSPWVVDIVSRNSHVSLLLIRGSPHIGRYCYSSFIVINNTLNPFTFSIINLKHLFFIVFLHGTVNNGWREHTNLLKYRWSTIDKGYSCIVIGIASSLFEKSELKAVAPNTKSCFPLAK